MSDNVVKLGIVRATSGLVALADADYIDSKWRGPAQAAGHWVVDFHGPDAEFLGHRHGGPNSIKLSDGGWRIKQSNRDQARTIAAHAKRYSDRQKVPTRISVMPATCSRLVAADTTRETGVGMLPGDHVLAMHAPNGVTVEAVMGKDGKVAELRLIPV